MAYDEGHVETKHHSFHQITIKGARLELPSGFLYPDNQPVLVATHADNNDIGTEP